MRPHLVRVLNVGAAVARTGVQELLAALVVADRRSNQKVSDIRSGLAAIEAEVPVGGAGIALIDLQIAKLSTKLQGVTARDLREAVGKVKGVVGLKGGERVNADREIVEILRWYGLGKSSRSRWINPQGSNTSHKTEVGELREAALRFVCDRGSSEETRAPLVHRCRAEVLRVTHYKLLRAGWS